MIDDVKSLRTRYAEPKARSLAKQLDRLDAHCTRFVALSPFFVVASGSSDHRFDASPRGGAPGFVKVLDEKTLLIPDLHCAKALMRSKLWDSERHVERSVLPTMGQMINDQTGGREAPETQEQMLARYAQDL